MELADAVILVGALGGVGVSIYWALPRVIRFRRKRWEVIERPNTDRTGTDVYLAFPGQPDKYQGSAQLLSDNYWEELEQVKNVAAEKAAKLNVGRR